MQVQVQEGIDFPAVRSELALLAGRYRLEQQVVLGVCRDYVGCDRLQRRQQFARAVPAPCLDEELARLTTLSQTR
jgi:hypothetical protein